MKEPSEIIKYFNGNEISEDEILKEQEKLWLDLELCGEEFRQSELLKTQAILRLEEIRVSGRYRFGYATWDECVAEFTDAYGIGNSTAKKYLKWVRMWKTLGREPQKLLEYRGGVGTFDAVTEGVDKIINEYNRTTGEVVSLTSQWEQRLEGETAAEKLNAFIDQIPEEMTRKMMAHSLYMETPAQARIEFIGDPEKDPLQIEWRVEEPDKKYAFGHITIAGIKQMNPKARAALCKRLGL